MNVRVSNVNIGTRRDRPLRRIGITIGDPAGIGPEVVLKALADEQLRERANLVLIGDKSLLAATARLLNLNFTFDSYKSVTNEPSAIQVNDPGDLAFDVSAGIESAATGRAAALCILNAVEMWRAGEIDAISTAPISKNALALAGYNYPGHTEFLAELTGTTRFAMSFFADKLRVVLLSTHCSLLEAIERVTTESLVDLIKFTDESLGKMLNRKIRLAVAGLNPHASEGGMFGAEEAAEIRPAIEQCINQFAIDVSGPYSPDTVFLRGFRGEFDAVIACYHDQATIAVKSLSFGSSVNVTLGLPLIRTSVDHGTAFDIAGKGIADESSMKAAINLAIELAGDSKAAAQL